MYQGIKFDVHQEKGSQDIWAVSTVYSYVPLDLWISKSIGVIDSLICTSVWSLMSIKQKGGQYIPTSSLTFESQNQ
jgi:hypothetical protein